MLLLTCIIPNFEYCVYEPSFIDIVQESVERTLSSLIKAEATNGTVDIFVHELREFSQGRLTSIEYRPNNLSYWLGDPYSEHNVHWIDDQNGQWYVPTLV